MLKTALKPQWILALLGALLVASGFVLLSQWQFNRSQSAAPPPPSTTETAVPLTGHIRPHEEMMGFQADQIVTASGRFLPGKQVLVRDRLQQGEKGFWVVAPFAVDGAPEGETIAVVRGWQADASAPRDAPSGQLDLTGRLLPTESPIEEPVSGALGAVSAAQLINLWDVPAYSGFVVAFGVATEAGADAGAATTGLEPVHVGPQPQEQQINWLNVFYGIEWFVFAGFAVFLWYRLVADDYRRQQEDLEDAAAALRSTEAPDAPAQDTQQTIPEKEQA
ncbi:SURF1 family protein [Arthrobacter ginkgonis]|uniref:SURF1-like protein n=1 Tax=Arthrobacter ginkgonis TaxID=1630594 RepID=A0ABP7BWW2_9MICC